MTAILAAPQPYFEHNVRVPRIRGVGVALVLVATLFAATAVPTAALVPDVVENAAAAILPDLVQDALGVAQADAWGWNPVKFVTTSFVGGALALGGCAIAAVVCAGASIWVAATATFAVGAAFSGAGYTITCAAWDTYC